MSTFSYFPPVAALDLRVGDRIKFMEEATSYTVRSLSERFVVITKPAPFKITGTLEWYTIIDWAQGRRGPHNSYGHGVSTQAEITATQEALDEGSIEVSRRHHAALNVDWVETPRRYFSQNEELL